MILRDHKTLDLYDVPLMETAFIDEPTTFPNIMSKEACYIYVKKGKMQTFNAIESHEIGVDESVLMKCGNYIGKTLPSEGCTYYQAVVIHLNPEVLKRVYADGMPDFLNKKIELPQYRTLAKIKREELFSKYMDGIFFYFENPELVTEEILVLKLKELLLLLANTKDAEAIRQLLSNLFQPQNLQFKDVVEANVFSDISIENLAVLTNNSLSSFKREFKRIYDDSPARYIRNKKLEKAANLIKNTIEHISSIAYDCGFNDVSHFSKVFRKKYGMAPTEWR